MGKCFTPCSGGIRKVLCGKLTVLLFSFGAAVEDFVVHDAINQVFAAKFKGFDFNDPIG